MTKELTEPQTKTYKKLYHAYKGRVINGRFTAI